VPLDFRSLVRVRATAPQTGMTVAVRRKNLRGAFAWRAGSEVKNLRVALVDDVMTTGSTVQAAAQCLRAAGVRDVEIWVIARA
jgi:predicted amidophosphoribosyltransferase